ncbi:hypothetical protein ACFVYF_17505 [Streptomyces sp. NPDC058274]|uniref:hypothetical protein n=1 Tax=Streptomyces sp. NPDC058274 TaxID=3346416 RepID=UPI0036EE98C7
MPAVASAPIYDRLVVEQGDVLANARHAAQETERTAENVLDFRAPEPRGPLSAY